MIPAVTDELRRELATGESLLWAGQPRQGIRFRQTDLFLVPFSLLWAGFVLFWESSVIVSDAPLFFVLWGIPFIAVGIYITVGRFFVDSYQRARTYYGLTERRALIVNRFAGRQVRSVDLLGQDQIGLTERPDRSGTITFGAHHAMTAMWAGTAWPGLGKFRPPAFELIDDARAVYDQLHQARERLRRPGA